VAEREELILEVSAKLDDAKSQVADLQAELDKLAEPTEVALAATVEGQEAIDALVETTETLDGTEATVMVDAEDAASDVVDGVAAGVGDLDGTSAEVALEADDEASDAVEDVADAVDDLDGTTAEVTIEADTEDATSGIADMNTELEGLIAGGGGAAKALGLGAGGLAGVLTALGGLGTKAFEFTGQVEELSLFTGDALEDASALLAVMQDYTKIDISQLEGVIARLVDKMAKAPELADQLGINLANISGPLDLFVQTFDALDNEAIDATERMRIAMQLFGRGGIKAVNEIRASIKGDLSDAIAEVGDARIINEEDLAAADQLEAAIGDLNGALNDMAQTLGEQVIPQLTILAEVGAPAVNLLTAGLANQLGMFTKFINDTRFLWQQLVGDTEEAPRFELTSGIEQWVDEMESAAVVVPSSMNTINGAFNSTMEVMGRQDVLWGRLLRDLEDNTVGTEKGQEAWNALRDELGLTNEEMARLAMQKLDAKFAADMKAAQGLADSLVGVVKQFQNTASSIEDIRLTRFEGLGDELQNALDMGDVRVDFQSVKEGLRDAFVDLQEFIDEEGAPDWSAMLRSDVDVAGFNSEIAGLITTVRDQFQSGIVSAFDIGGASAAQHFVTSFLPQLTALGMSPEQAYQLLGLPSDGSVEVLLAPIIDVQARDRAQQILSAISGVDPGNPIIAALQIALTQDNIDPELIEIAAVVQAHEMGIPVSLDAFTPEQLAQAQAILDNGGLVVPVAADTAPAEEQVKALITKEDLQTLPVTAKAEIEDAVRKYHDFVTTKREAVVTGKPEIAAALAALDGLKSDKGKGGPRLAPISAVAETSVANILLAIAARARQADINTALHGAGDANFALDVVARDRIADIFVQTHNLGSVSGALGAVGAAPVVAAPGGVGPLGAAAPLGATTPVTSSTTTVVADSGGEVHQHFHTSINAGVIGNRFQLGAILRDLNRSSARLVGSRQTGRSKL
jgi:hypothetical protein